MKFDTELILASSSPFRQALLRQVGIPFQAVSPQVDERAVEQSFEGRIDELAQHLAVAKAESLSKKFTDHPIVGSDQVLILEGKVLHKPSSLDEVKQRLSLLQEKTHRLYTGLCLYTSTKVYQTTVTADMTMYPLTENEIDEYAQLDQAIGCAGGYKIESYAPLLFEKIETSDHNSIIGLPLLALVSFLRDLAISRP